MRYLIPFILFLMGCSSEYSLEEFLAEAPQVGTAQYDDTESFELSLGSYKDSATIKYCIVNDPPEVTRDETESIIEGAIDKWANAVGKPFIQVDSIADANIYVEFVLMDGVGGQLGSAQFPPYSDIKEWNRYIVIDAYDVNRVSDMDPVQIIAHEFGHALGLKHSHNSSSLMYPLYKEGQDIRIDDHFGARILYDNKKKFYFEGRGYIPITDTSDYLTENFKTSEFFSRCYKFPYDFHFLDEQVVYALQIIRYHYDVPIQILSTYRTHECNSAAGGAISSRHMEGQAVDFKFIGSRAAYAYDEFMLDIKLQGCLFQTLVNNGIGGFGAYPTSFHIDSRRSGLQKWNNLRYSLWGLFIEGGYFVDDEHPWGI